MRKLSSLAGAALMAATVLAIPAPASAQSMSAGGSCGPSFGNYRYNDELESQAATINLGTASNSGGTIRRQIFAGANPIIEGGAAVGFTGPDPETQGFNNSSSGNRGNP